MVRAMSSSTTNFPPRRDPNFGIYEPEELSAELFARVTTFVTALVEDLDKGIDISYWNWAMTWDVTLDDSLFVEFVYTRGGYGILTDPHFVDYNTELVKRAVLTGIYWYVYVGSINMDAQVNAFVAALEFYKWQLPPMADFETTSLDPINTTNWIKLFMEKLQARVAERVGIYTSPGWWNANVLPNDWARKYYLWVAHWTTLSAPILPYDWTTCLFWQKSADGNLLGKVYGSSGDADMDIDFYMGDGQTWMSFELKLHPLDPVPVPDPDPATPEGTYRVLTDGLRIRTAPSIFTGSVVGVRAKDEIVTPDETGILEIWVRDSKGWSAVLYQGVEYMLKL